MYIRLAGRWANATPYRDRCAVVLPPALHATLGGQGVLRQLPRIKIPATRVLSYPFQALVLARLPKSLGGDDERTEGTAHCHHQRRGPEIDRGQEKGVSSPSGFGLPQRQCSASRSRVWLVP